MAGDFDVKIYTKSPNTTINNHFVNKVSTTFFENENNFSVFSALPEGHF
jgi:hypothetical protein